MWLFLSEQYMVQNFKLRNNKITKLQNCQGGYILITLMLVFTLLAVAMLAVLPSVHQQFQRDREDELRHRGTMYMRAVQHYYKKMGAYPTSLEALENTNHLRFLRKRYKDPMSTDPQTGKERDFKILHMQDITLNNGPRLGQMPGGAPGAGGLPSLGGALGPGGQAGLAGAAALGGLQNALGQMGGMQPQFNSQNQNINAGSSDNSDSSNTGNSSGNSPSSFGVSNSNGPGLNNGNSPTPGSSAGGSPLSGQVFGGGPILGVASTNKKDTSIREFNKKNHYNDWYFIYDSSMDRGGLLIGPWQPLMLGGAGSAPGMSAGGLTPGGSPNSGMGQGFSQSGFGQSGFGQSGFGQSGFGQSGFGQPQNPTPNPQNPPQNPN